MHGLLAVGGKSIKDIGSQFREAGEVAFGSQPPALPVVATNMIRGALGLLGVVFIGLIIYAGVLWMTAQGDDKQVTKAKNVLIQAIIGLTITISAYAITNFVISGLVTATK